jgi:hypothetical protein
MVEAGWNTEGDAVFRGGGVKGLGLARALLGFYQHSSKPITKWVNVASASADAIIASYLAVGHDAKDMIDLLKKRPNSVRVTHQGDSDYARDVVIDRLDLQAANEKLKKDGAQEATSRR